MNSNIKIRLAIAAFALLTLSCSSSISTISREAKAVQIPSEPVVQMPLVGELDVRREKVSVTIARGKDNKSVELLKQEALTKAVKETEADVIIEPQFDVDVKKGMVETVTLQGFPAKYTRFRPIQEADTVWAKNGLVRPKISVVSNQKTTKADVTKKSNSGIIWGTILGICLPVLVVLLLL